MRRYLVTLDLRLPNDADDTDYVKALIKAAARPVRARLVPDGKTPLVSDGNEQTEQEGESDGKENVS